MRTILCKLATPLGWSYVNKLICVPFRESRQPREDGQRMIPRWHRVRFHVAQCWNVRGVGWLPKAFQIDSRELQNQPDQTSRSHSLPSRAQNVGCPRWHRTPRKPRAVVRRCTNLFFSHVCARWRNIIGLFYCKPNSEIESADIIASEEAKSSKCINI